MSNINLNHKTFKTMKLLVVITIMFSCLASFGQEYKTSISDVNKKKISIYLDKVGLEILATNSSEIVIKTEDEFTIPERAKGLKPLHNSAEDNTGIGLEVEKTPEGIVVKRASGKSVDYVFEIPKDFNILLDLGFQCDDVNLDGFAGEVEIESKVSSIDIKNMNGPLTINTLSGDIVVVYNNDAIKGPTTLNCVSGDIDVTLTKTAKLNLELNTISGEVFVKDPSKFMSPHEDEEGLYHIGGQNITTKYNGGGIDMNLITISGNIYFREE
jgi:Toastrack DUF4097